MPLTRTLIASRSCLKCQLRRAIFQPGTCATSPCCVQHDGKSTRRLSTSDRRLQGAGEGEQEALVGFNKIDDDGRALYRQKRHLGRIVGQQGRRRIESSETLKIDSLSRPFNVVLMEDFDEPKFERASVEDSKPDHSLNETKVDVAELAHRVLEPDTSPAQQEVDESIDALRPNNSVLDREQYKGLSKRLSDGYNFQQLSSYLARVSTPSSSAQNQSYANVEDGRRVKNDLHESNWRPGTTLMSERHVSFRTTQRRENGSKKRIIDAILERGWNITSQTEEQQIGELEIILRTWQMQYLFDLKRNSRPICEDIIRSSLLRRNSELLPHRQDNVVRVRARRSDAEEIVALIAEEFREVRKLELDLSVFKPLLGKGEWPKTFTQLFRQSDLNFVGQHTGSVIVQENERTVCIYNRSVSAQQHGKRLLLSLLDLPSPRSISTLDPKTLINDGIPTDEERLFPVPADLESSFQYRFHELSLSRFAVPSEKAVTNARSTQTQNVPPETQHFSTGSKFVAMVAGRIVDLNGTQIPGSDELSASQQDRASTADDASYWEPSKQSPPWEVQFCRILQTSIGSSDAKGARKSKSPKQRSINVEQATTTVQVDLPGTNTLLSYFSPVDRSKYAFDDSRPSPHLVAHFFPSPFTSEGIDILRHLPRLELWYESAAAEGKKESTIGNPLRLAHVKAVLHQQELRVPLPSEAVDIRFVRKIPLTGNLSSALRDEDITQFTETLNQSASAEHGALEGQAELLFKLPQRLFPRKDSLTDRLAAQGTDIKMPYVFERFEQVQAASFEPLRSNELAEPIDSVMNEVLETMRNTLFLDYKVIEGGVIGGSRTEITLKRPTEPGSAILDNQMTDTSMDHNLDLVEAALRLTNVLTRINSRELQAMRTPIQSTSN